MTFSKPLIVLSVNEVIRLANIIKPTKLSDFTINILSVDCKEGSGYCCEEPLINY